MYIINSNVTTPKRVLAFDASPHTWFNGDCKEISQLKASYLTGSILAGSQLERTPSILFYRSLLFSCHRLRDPYLRLIYQQMFCAGRLQSFCHVLAARRGHYEWALSLLRDSDRLIVSCAP